MDGRDEHGRFIKGHKSNGGRPDKATRDDLKATIDANVSFEAVSAAWQRIASFMLAGGRGWQDCFELYLAYRYGKPAQAVDLTSGGQPLRSDPLTDAERTRLLTELADGLSGAAAGPGPAGPAEPVS